MSDLSGDVIVQVFKALFTQAPELLISVVGVVLAIVTWQRHGRASLFALLGFGLLLVLPIPMTLLYQVVLPGLYDRMNMEYDAIDRMYRSVAFVHSLLRSGAFGLLSFAIFYPRGSCERSGLR